MKPRACADCDQLDCRNELHHDVELDPLMKIEVKDGQTTSITRVASDELTAIVEEFVGYWHLNREQSVNKTYDYIDKITKRLRAAMEEQR